MKGKKLASAIITFVAFVLAVAAILFEPLSRAIDRKSEAKKQPSVTVVMPAPTPSPEPVIAPSGRLYKL